ncbi:MAG: septation protein A [Burkholderiaceae bacterium]
MKLLFDFLPILLFFVAFKAFDIYIATATAVLASIAQIVWLRIRGRPIEPLQWISLAIIVVFGGLTLILRDETFIKWKPTVLYLVFAGTLIGGRLLAGRNLMQALMGGQIELPAARWEQLNWAWAGFFACMAVANLAVAYGFSTETWVQFKVFGTLGLTLLFVLAQGFWITRGVETQE